MLKNSRGGHLLNHYSDTLHIIVLVLYSREGSHLWLSDMCTLPAMVMALATKVFILSSTAAVLAARALRTSGQMNQQTCTFKKFVHHL